MKKLMMSVACLALCGAVFAVEAPAKKAPLTDAEKAALLEKRLKKTGGTLMKEGQGRIVIVNAQDKFKATDVTRNMEALKKALRVNIETRMGSWKLGTGLPEGANAAIYLVDDAALPMSLVAVESVWGVMNVASLKTPQQFDREFARVATLALGGAVSKYSASPMKTVRSTADLDALTGSAITIDGYQCITENLTKIGITREQMTTYRKACEEGWAQAPTNDFQKAIWDEIHATPSEPIKIKFDGQKAK